MTDDPQHVITPDSIRAALKAQGIAADVIETEITKFYASLGFSPSEAKPANAAPEIKPLHPNQHRPRDRDRGGGFL